MGRVTPKGMVPVIVMHFKDTDHHKEPHFHMATADERVSVAIRDFRILAGGMRAKDLRKGLAWAEENVSLIKEKWDAFNPHQPFKE